MEARKCLNPKCDKEFTPKNAKGVYCSGNCRAAHAYQMKRVPVSSIKMVDLPADYVNTNRVALLTEDGQTIDITHATEPIPEWATKWFKEYVAEIHAIENEPILKQIEAIKAEKIPQGRDTTFGKVVWQKEQDAKIAELTKKLK